MSNIPQKLFVKFTVKKILKYFQLFYQINFYFQTRVSQIKQKVIYLSFLNQQNLLNLQNAIFHKFVAFKYWEKSLTSFF